MGEAAIDRVPVEIRRYRIGGIVQGVGFRPFVFRAAEQRELSGWVRNDSNGVLLEVRGVPEALESFVEEINAHPPALARVDSVVLLGRRHELGRGGGFEIRASERSASARTLVSPDVCVCPDCLRELNDPSDRRYRYPYVNCTNCGPRFSIVRSVPYDRAATTMASFPMCASCRREYGDVRDRRFHAQPVACWECGPQLALVHPGEPPRFPPRGRSGSPDVARLAARMLGEGAILAVKGIGGYHLMVDARNDRAVAELRQRKRREEKPLALMSANLDAVRRYAKVDAAQAELLQDPRRPIVLLKRRVEPGVSCEVGRVVCGVGHVGCEVGRVGCESERVVCEGGGCVSREGGRGVLSEGGRGVLSEGGRGALGEGGGGVLSEGGRGALGEGGGGVLGEGGGGALSEGVAPGNRHYGVMLAYAPLHHLLFQDGPDTVVATSGNVSDEPIAFEDGDALERLVGIADAFVVGEREIHARVDDSIVRAVSLAGRTHPVQLRRARGYAPEPLQAPIALPDLLAVGPELKSTVCLAKGSELFMSQHIGDLKNAATLRSFRATIEHLSSLHEVEPGAVAHDMHPGYASTKYALARRAVRKIAVQHHHAHLAACMCEHGLCQPVIGIVFDGTGYGTDGNIWGGEALVGDYAGFERAMHLRYFSLPGGDLAIREPYRAALSLLYQAEIPLERLDVAPLSRYSLDWRRAWQLRLASSLNAPLTSSMGRLFDGVAALICGRERCRYEAQAAIELEQLIEPGAKAHPFPWRMRGGERWPCEIDPAPITRALVRELQEARADPAELSLRFHLTVVEMVVQTCQQIRARTGIGAVVLSGGVFQNEFLLRGCHGELDAAGFDVYSHAKVPTNDGGVALGQAMVAGWALAQPA